MKQLNVVQINSALFSHSAERKLLVAEHSDIGGASFQYLYKESCAVGFALRNPKTGNVTRWAIDRYDRCPRENELLAWILKPTAESVAAQPQLSGYKMHILND